VYWKVSIVDAHASGATIWQSTVETHDYAVSIADSGPMPPAVGLARLRLDAMVPDLGTREMSGLEVPRRSEGMPRTARIPMILVTAEAQSETPSSGDRARVADPARRRFSAGQLLCRLDLVLG